MYTLKYQYCIVLRESTHGQHPWATHLMCPPKRGMGTLEGFFSTKKNPVPSLWFVFMHHQLASITLHRGHGLLLDKVKDARVVSI